MVLEHLCCDVMVRQEVNGVLLCWNFPYVVVVVVVMAKASLGINSKAVRQCYKCGHLGGVTFLALMLLHLLNVVPASSSFVLTVLLHTKLAPESLAVV